MKVTVEMGQEEFIAFVNFREARPKMIAEIAKLRAELHEIAEAANAAITENGGAIQTDAARARALLDLAGKYL